VQKVQYTSSANIITGENMAKKNVTTETETNQIKITLTQETFENLTTASAYAGITKSKYIEKLLQKKFKKITDDTTKAEMKKIMKI